MASLNISFEDLRIILCVQGYSLDYQFIVREIGFWYNGLSGSIPFNVKINRNLLDINSQKIIYALEEEVHGIRLKKSIEHGLAASEVKAVLRTLYHMAGSTNAKYIGICRDENINGLLYKAGLGNYVVDIDSISLFRNTVEKTPSNKDLKLFMENNKNKYSVCRIHDVLRNGEIPLCAKVKAQFIADYCINLKNNDKYFNI